MSWSTTTIPLPPGCSCSRPGLGVGGGGFRHVIAVTTPVSTVRGKQVFVAWSTRPSERGSAGDVRAVLQGDEHPVRAIVPSPALSTCLDGRTASTRVEASRLVLIRMSGEASFQAQNRHENKYESAGPGSVDVVSTRSDMDASAGDNRYAAAEQWLGGERLAVPLLVARR